MAIVMQIQWPEVTPQQFDDARERVGWERDAPIGGLLHVAWFDGGLHVWDVWESAEAFQAFVGERLMPGIATLGIAGEPQVTMRELYAYQVEELAGASAVVEVGGMPAAGYAAVEGRVNWRDVPPTGGIAHIAARTGDDVETLSVWSSPADRERFVAERLVPAFGELGIEPTVAEPAFRPLHLMFHPAAVPAS